MQDLRNGGVGMLASASSLTVSLTTTILWLQLVSLLVGIAVGLYTIWIMRCNRQRKDEEHRLKIQAKDDEEETTTI